MDFLDYYRDNLAYLRGLSAEFAGEFPKIAGRLDLSEFECQDPYVERLLEGTAFLAARVEKKLDESYVRLLESLLASMAPSSLSPIPSGAILEVSPDPGNDKVRQGENLPRGTLFDTFIPTVNTPCRWSTFLDTPLSLFTVTRAEYLTRVDLGPGAADAASALHLTLESLTREPAALPPAQRFYLNLPDDLASLLLRQLMVDRVSVSVSSTGKAQDYRRVSASVELPLTAAVPVVNGAVRGNMRGLSLLQSFLAYPAFFRFFTLKTPGAGKIVSSGPVLDILILFRTREAALGGEVKNPSIKLNCVPVLNLFPKRSNRIPLQREAYEYHVVPERTAMRDYEVVNIRSLEFFNEQNESLFTAAGFYDYDPRREVSPQAEAEPETINAGERARWNFFSQHRRRSLFPRTRGGQQAARSSYDGTEVFITFSGQDIGEAYQFMADLVCTNRDLPLLLPAEVSLVSSGDMAPKGTFLGRPSRPGYPLIERGDRGDFAKLSHILYNLSGLLWRGGEFPLVLFKAMLGNYRLRQDEEIARMIDGILKIEADPESFRFISQGAVFFERGWKVNLTLDEAAYAGIGSYLYAFVLQELLRAFTPLNSMLEVNFFTRQAGLVASWRGRQDG